MVVVLKKESESSAKRRSLILAIMLCGSVVMVGWAAYLVGEVTPDQAPDQSAHKQVAQIDLRSPSVYHLSDQNGTSPVLQVERRGLENRAAGPVSAGKLPVVADRNSTTADRYDAGLTLPRAEFSGVSQSSSSVPLEPVVSSNKPQPVERDLVGRNLDRTLSMAESLKQSMKLGKVEIGNAPGKELGEMVPVISASYEENFPPQKVEAKEKTDVFRILAGRLPGFEIPSFMLTAPVVHESSASRSASSPRLPWRLPSSSGE
ncbi:MAG: hypothetical protein QGH11_10060 [Pirellulaceae bacterium]|nr:hypothetical protein [Pirellulaceae bacterium]